METRKRSHGAQLGLPESTTDGHDRAGPPRVLGQVVASGAEAKTVTHIVSFSGGKDSTYMLHAMRDRGERVEAAVFFDWHKEFPQMAAHLALVEEKTGLKIVRLHPPHSWEHEMYEKPIRARRDYPAEGVKAGEIRHYGHGWPSWTRRWCTRIKVDAIDKWVKEHYSGAVQCIGFAADEQHRTGSDSQERKKRRIRYPLIEYGITEAECLQGCLDLGYHWGGLYDIFDRVSCAVCPLGGIGAARRKRRHYPEVWAEILRLDAKNPAHCHGYVGYKSAHDLDRRFADEERQMMLAGMN